MKNLCEFDKIKTIKNKTMYNRKFDTHKDFHELVELESEIMPKIRRIENKEDREILQSYVRKIFDNQWKK